MASDIRKRWGGERAKAKRVANADRKGRRKQQRRALLLQQLDSRAMLAGDTFSYMDEHMDGPSYMGSRNGVQERLAASPRPMIACLSETWGSAFARTAPECFTPG